MTLPQAIPHPFGVTVFGSSIVRSAPDIASLTFAVSRLAQHPKDAFHDARTGAQAVRNYLVHANMTEVGSSRINLSQSFRYIGGEQRFEGYLAKVSFHVLLRDLDRLEEVTAGVVDAGANEVHGLEFQTSYLKEIRAEARQRAVVAAREKAELYCTAAGVRLGRVIHIEDVNPDSLRGREGHVVHETQPDDEGTLGAFDPGSIVVGAAVLVAFEIQA
jgi:uncharacterized protein